MRSSVRIDSVSSSESTLGSRSEELMEVIQNEVDRFSQGQRPSDDRTLIVVKRV
jgi:hypothetical protein